MNRDRCRSTVLDDLCNLHRIDMILVKSFSYLYRQWLVDRLCHRRHDLADQFRILHQCGSLAVIYHLRHRASHIDIQDIKRFFFDLFCHLAHDLRI